jgi:site-specific DNA recombinase
MTELELLASAKRTMDADRAELVRRLADAETDRTRVRTLTEWIATVSANLETLTYDERRIALEALGVRVRTHKPGATDEHGTPLDRWEVTMQPVGVESAVALGSTCKHFSGATSSYRSFGGFWLERRPNGCGDVASLAITQLSAWRT